MVGLLRAFYRLSSGYWSYRAVKRGDVPQRMMRKGAYRASGRIIRKLFR
ncbi:MAG: hypothetical protein ACRDFS_06120 [Chloroflexota bacterium]